MHHVPCKSWVAMASNRRPSGRSRRWGATALPRGACAASGGRLCARAVDGNKRQFVADWHGQPINTFLGSVPLRFQPPSHHPAVHGSAMLRACVAVVRTCRAIPAYRTKAAARCGAAVACGRLHLAAVAAFHAVRPRGWRTEAPELEEYDATVEDELPLPSKDAAGASSDCLPRCACALTPRPAARAVVPAAQSWRGGMSGRNSCSTAWQWTRTRLQSRR